MRAAVSSPPSFRSESRSLARFVARALRVPVRGYQLLISPLIGPRCRYLPTCSEYALDALDQHGAVGGSWLTLKRVGRCHPWGSSGYDPVPQPRPLETKGTRTTRL